MIPLHASDDRYFAERSEPSYFTFGKTGYEKPVPPAGRAPGAAARMDNEDATDRLGDRDGLAAISPGSSYQ